MRVIAGTARGRRLATFQGTDIRPTPDRVREALFSMLLSRLGSLQGARVLDLFAGSGAMGIEAISRGARHAWFVDNSAQGQATIEKNLQLSGLADRATLIDASVTDVLPVLASQGPFDLIFLDPPYAKGLAPATLERILALDLLAPDGMISAETGAKEVMPATLGNLEKTVEKRYGSTSIHLYHFAGQDNT